MAQKGKRVTLEPGWLSEDIRAATSEVRGWAASYRKSYFEIGKTGAGKVANSRHATRSGQEATPTRTNGKKT